MEHLSPTPGASIPESVQSLPCLTRNPTGHCRSFRSEAPFPFRRTIRRQELRQIIPLSETTIYEMERRGEFPRRFNLTPRCVVWDLAGGGKLGLRAQAGALARRSASRMSTYGKPAPVRAGSDQNKTGCRPRPTRAPSSSEVERGRRRLSLARLTCKATRATSRTSLASE